MHVKRDGKKEKEGAQAAWVLPAFACACFAYRSKHGTKHLPCGSLNLDFKVFYFCSKYFVDTICGTVLPRFVNNPVKSI